MLHGRYRLGGLIPSDAERHLRSIASSQRHESQDAAAIGQLAVHLDLNLGRSVEISSAQRRAGNPFLFLKTNVRCNFGLPFRAVTMPLAGKAESVFIRKKRSDVIRRISLGHHEPATVFAS